MTITTIGEGIFGAEDPKPLKGWPKGRVKLRIRNNDFVYAYVRTEEGIVCYSVAEKDGYWIPGYLQGINFKKG